MSGVVDKKSLIDQIIARLTSELESITAAARDNREAATHEEARAEDKYDTRATESSYLADGQARIAAELHEAIEVYRTLIPRAFGPGEPIALTAIVELEQRNARDLYFLGPRNGGLEIRWEDRDILVLTPQSPLGQKLVGRTVDNAIQLEGGRQARITAVW